MTSLAAVHECGHALVARAYARGPVEARLRPHEGGECLYTPAEAPTRLEGLRRRVTVALAGSVSELLSEGRDPLGPAEPAEIAARILRRECRPAAPRGEPHPRTWLVPELCSIFGDEVTAWAARDLLLEESLRRSLDLLREQRSELERLAERLERERTIVI